MKNNVDSANNNIVWVLTIFTVPVSYFFAYRFEVGYASYFGISSQLISLDITRIMSAIFIFFTFFFLILYLIYVSNVVYLPLQELIHKHFREPIFREVKRVLPIWFIYFFYIYSIGLSISSYFILGFAIIISFFHFLFPLIIKTPGSTYADILENQHKIEANTETTVSLLVKHIGVDLSKWVVFVIILFAFVNIFAYFLGIREARTSRSFLITNESEEKVVLRTYDNIMVLAPFNRDKKVVYPEFIIKDLSSLEVSLKEEAIGPLKLKENNQQNN